MSGGFSRQLLLTKACGGVGLSRSKRQQFRLVPLSLSAGSMRKAAGERRGTRHQLVSQLPRRASTKERCSRRIKFLLTADFAPHRHSGGGGTAAAGSPGGSGRGEAGCGADAAHGCQALGGSRCNKGWLGALRGAADAALHGRSHACARCHRGCHATLFDGGCQCATKRECKGTCKGQPRRDGTPSGWTFFLGKTPKLRDRRALDRATAFCVLKPAAGGLYCTHHGGPAVAHLAPPSASKRCRTTGLGCGRNMMLQRSGSAWPPHTACRRVCSLHCTLPLLSRRCCRRRSPFPVILSSTGRAPGAAAYVWDRVISTVDILIIPVSFSLQPPRKSHVTKILPNVAGLRTDEQLQEFLQQNKNDTVRPTPARPPACLHACMAGCVRQAGCCIHCLLNLASRHGWMHAALLLPFQAHPGPPPILDPPPPHIHTQSRTRTSSRAPFCRC